jgi:hypothetical protein
MPTVYKLIGRIAAPDGIVVEHIDIDDGEADNYNGFRPRYSFYQDVMETDFKILSGLQILDFVDTGFFMLGNRWKVKILYYHVTALGLAFASARGVCAPTPPVEIQGGTAQSSSHEDFND